jgi:hypothetical protein
MSDTTSPHPAAVELRKLSADVYEDRLIVVNCNGIEVAAICFDYFSRQAWNRERCALEVRPILYATPQQNWPSFTAGGYVHISPDAEVHERNETLVELLTRGLNDGKPYAPAPRRVWK